MKTNLIFLFFFLLASPMMGVLPYTVMFYNVENYFDCVDDTTTQDNDFLPEGIKKWSAYRMAVKRTNIARVIAAVGQGSAPVLVGLCEVENDELLRQLVRYKPLSSLRYEYVHYESPDMRGIDVALLYQPTCFTPLHSRAIPICLSDGKPTRDVLYVKGLLSGSDTLHVLVCHAPSRRGGDEASAWRRAEAMTSVKNVIDSVLRFQVDASVLLMGDFNDTPQDSSICKVLGAMPYRSSADTLTLHNLMVGDKGTYKYKSEWSLFDQFVVSKSLLKGGGIIVENQRAYVYDARFLLQTDNTYMGYKPYRTYLGPRYVGGFSDHLPIYLRLQPVH